MIEDQHDDETKEQESIRADMERFKELMLRVQVWKIGDDGDPDKMVEEYFKLRKKLFGY